MPQTDGHSVGLSPKRKDDECKQYIEVDASASGTFGSVGENTSSSSAFAAIAKP